MTSLLRACRCAANFVLLLCAACMCFVPEASADLLDAIVVQETDTKRVAFFPALMPIYLYENQVLEHDIDVAFIRRAVIAHAQRHPVVRVLRESMIATHVKTSNLEQRDRFAQAEIDLVYARSHFANMNYGLAISSLQRVVRSYQDALAPYYAPHAVAPAYQMLAYAYLAQIRETQDEDMSQFHAARLAMMEMIRLAPHLALLEGRQPRDRIHVYNEARQLFLDNPVYRQTPLADAARLAQSLELNRVIFMRLVQDAQGDFSVELDIYDHDKRSMQHETIAVSERDEEEGGYSALISQAMTMVLENVYACFEMPRPDDVSIFSDEAGRVFLELGFVYFTHLNFPTSSLVHALGADALVTYMLTKHFYVQGGLGVVSVRQDLARDLYAPFEMVRLYGGAGLSADFNWIRLFLSVGLEYAYSTPYAITRSVTCKTFGRHDLDCSPSSVRDNTSPSEGGFHLSTGVNLGVDPFYFVLEGFVVAYLFPFVGNFRYPLGFRAALQYRF
ncbi:MAG: hypothetical protein FWC40_04665 [Proteobacteria bacterium]|nr:hypothetical protein [Pseudomonadota bacterium]